MTTLVLAAALLTGPILEELYRNTVVSEIKSDYISAAGVLPYLDMMKSTTRPLVPLYLAPGVLRANCSTKGANLFGELGCFSWDKFPGSFAVISDADSAFGSDSIVERSCQGEGCTYVAKYAAYVRQLSRDETTEKLNAFHTDRTCGPVNEAGTLLKYSVQFCRDCTYYNSSLLRASFSALVSQPLYLRPFADVWFRVELPLTIDYGRDSITYRGQEETIKDLEASN